MAGAEQKRSSLLTEIDQTVNMINRQNITQQVSVAPVEDQNPSNPVIFAQGVILLGLHRILNRPDIRYPAGYLAE